MAGRLKHLRQHLNYKGFAACANYYEKNFKTKVADMAVDESESESQKSGLTTKTTVYAQQVMAATALKK